MKRLLPIPRLPRRQREAFSAVYAAPGATLTQVSRRLGVPLPHASELLAALEFKGLVEPQPGQPTRYSPARWTR